MKKDQEPNQTLPERKKGETISPLLIVFALIGFATAWRPLADMDFPWHLALGEAIAEHGPRLQTDPISYLQFEREVDMGAWLGELIFHWTESSFGLGGLTILIALVAALCHAWVFQESLRRSRDQAAAALTTAIFAACSIERWRGRPDIFSILLFLVLLTVLDLRQGWRRRTALFGLSLLWINLHPGAIVVPAFILASILASALRKDRAAIRSWLFDLALVLVALALTPWGPIETYRLVSMTVSTGHLVPEWLPLWDQPWLNSWPEWLLTLSVLMAAAIWRPKRRVFVSLLSMAMAIRSFRLLYMLTPLAGSSLETLARPRRRAPLFALAAVILLFFPLAHRWRWYQKTAARGESAWEVLYEPHYPVNAADFIERFELEGRLFHPVAWGGYLGWRLAPHNRTAHDGRISLWGSDRAEEMQDYKSVKSREQLRSALDFEILVVSPGLIEREELAALGGRWLPVYADPVAAVYIDVKAEHSAANLKRLPITESGR